MILGPPASVDMDSNSVLMVSLSSESSLLFYAIFEVNSREFLHNFHIFVKVFCCELLHRGSLGRIFFIKAFQYDWEVLW